MASPTVSINICTYNSSRYISATLRSVFAQTFQDFEIVIVDDGSTDGTPDLIARDFSDPRITVVRERHVTLRVARPLALAHSRGEFIAFLDSDDLWVDTKLERQLATARAHPDAGLIFSDCELIDAAGERLGRHFSDQFAYARIDFAAERVHLELLRRGNFIPSPTPIVPAVTLRALGGFNQDYRHVNDYELWLRLARQCSFVFIEQPLAFYRVHNEQFTQRRMEITLPEQCALLHPIMRSPAYPHEVRIAIGDNLFGQHRLAWCSFVAQRRYVWAARAALGMRRYPDRVFDYVRDKTKGTALCAAMETGIRAQLEATNLWARARARVRNGRRWLAHRARRLARIVTGKERLRHVRSSSPLLSGQQVWVDGTCLGREQVGYFNLLTELVRALTSHAAVHVTADTNGQRALRARLGDDADDIQFHTPGWRVLHWTQIHQLMVCWPAQLLFALSVVTSAVLGLVVGPSFIAVAFVLLSMQAGLLLDEWVSMLRGYVGVTRLTLVARVVRFAWRRWPAPRSHIPQDVIEVLFWRGRFRWRNSRRIAIVQDMTTRIHPELHTAGNIAEFDEFLGYVQRHAHEIVTVSAQSRRDIIERIVVSPERVSVMPMPVHPQYLQPRLSAGYVAMYGITSPYVLCVGTIEPRKNLRRVVKAFDLVRTEEALRGHELVLVGPQGWDDGFAEFLRSQDVSRRVRVVGYASLEHLPSLYHYATVVACASVYEGFGLPVLEAMCSSAVVIASNVSALPEVLGDGILFDPYDTTSIATALLMAASMSSDEQAAYRMRNRRRAETHLQRVISDGPLPGFTKTLTVAHP